MLKRLSLIIAFTAISTQALPLLYSFEGLINDGNVNYETLYQLVIDFDESAIEQSLIQNDFTIDGVSFDYASVDLYETSYMLYPSNEYYNKLTCYNKFVYHYYGLNQYENVVQLENKENGIITNSFYLKNTLQSVFQIGDIFSLTEKNETSTATGFATLTMISSVIPHSVPEPNTIILLLLAISGLWIFKQKKWKYEKSSSIFL